MWGVKGVQIRGCTFSNNQREDLPHRYAINSFDASYRLEDKLGYPSLVEGFYTGAHSTGYDLFRTNFISPIAVVRTTFDANELGLHFSDMQFPQIEENTFNIGAKQTPVPAGPYSYYSIGSKLDHVSNFTYCNNDHQKLYNPPTANFIDQYTSGTEVYNTGDFNQQIQKNNYVGLHVGNDAAYTCGSTVAGGMPNVGLNYSCNTNADNTGWDFMLQANAIVRNLQSLDFAGTVNQNKATGNTFTRVPGGNTKDWNHVPGGNGPVRYLHATAPNQIQEPLTPTPLTVAPINVINVPNCNDIICPDYREVYENPSRDRSKELLAAKTNYQTLESSYNAMNTAYEALIDDGDTPQRETDIENSTTADQMQIRAEMLSNSPFVSEEVLRTLAVENVVSQAILFEIIMANPEASRSDEFLKFLEYKAPNPLPTYMLNLIRASWNGQTARAGLEQNLSSLLSKMKQLSNSIMHIYSGDLQLRNETSMYEWMNKIPSLRGQYLNVEYWLGKRDVSQAERILNAIAAQWKMNEDEMKNHNAYVNLFNFKKSILAKGKDIHQLDSTEIAQLKVIADHTDYTFGRDAARNALCFFYEICYPIHQLIPTTSSNKQIEIKELKDDVPGIKVYPNPAKDHVTFQLVNNDGNCTDCRFFVSDLQGRKVYEGSLDVAFPKNWTV